MSRPRIFTRKESWKRPGKGWQQAVDELADADLQDLETYLRRSKLKSTASATATPASLILYTILIPGAIVAVLFCVWGSIHRREIALKKHSIMLQQLEE
ncbi:hypothetical protein FRC07_014182, partial [Ceratobasidium sp. 392]